jgi:hypothetical protein
LKKVLNVQIPFEPTFLNDFAINSKIPNVQSVPSSINSDGSSTPLLFEKASPGVLINYFECFSVLHLVWREGLGVL